MRRDRYIPFLVFILVVVAVVDGQAQSAEGARIAFLKRQIKAFIVRHLDVPRKGLVLEYADPAALRTVSHLEFDAVKVVAPANLVRLGIQTVPCEFYLKGKTVRRISFKVRVRRYQDVVVSVAKLNRHTILQPQHVQVRREETTRLRRQPFDAIDAVVGLRVNRIVQAGEIITENLVEPQPLITLGSRVHIVVERRGLQITLPGIARQEGRPGDMIKVKSVDTKKIFNAKILNGDTVLVKL